MYQIHLEIIEKELNKKLTVLHEFDVAWVGWECDSEACVAQDEDGKKHLILTNHGSPYIASGNDLFQKILEYQDLIKETRKAITFLEK